MERSVQSHLLAWMRLARVPGFGPVLVKRIVAALGSPQAVLAAHATRLESVEGIGRQRAESFARTLAKPEIAGEIEKDLALAAKNNIQILCPDDPAWPAGLKTIPDPPIILYVRGQLHPADAVAVGIVGARNCTLYGREQAERFGALLAEAGVCVISGGARGIDTGAHEGALRNKGRTLVIQGCGLLNNYPPDNKGLYDRIADGNGAIISELPLDAPPLDVNFPPRNRIIAGMSLGVLVIEANLRSGSLITARLAADDYGREVFALPGRVDSAASSGTHHLIKTGGARLVESIQDILEGLGDVGAVLKKLTQTPPPPTREPLPQNTAAACSADLLFAPELVAEEPKIVWTGVQTKIMAAFDGKPVSVDELCEKTALPASVLMAELTMLQIRGAIQRAGANRFAKK